MQAFILHTILLLSILVLVVIAFQDFKNFEVDLYLYVAGFVLLSVYVIAWNDIDFYFHNLLFNVVFIALLLTAVWLWFTIKKRKAIKLADNYMGWGDILFFFMVAPVFSINRFVLFLTSSFIVALAFSLVIYFRKKEFTKIPLAGIMSMGFICWMIYDYRYYFGLTIKNILN